jgi:predicted nucleic acid-binding protein
VILVVSSVWIDHLRAGDQALARLLERGAVLGHPWVTGELALGRLARRSEGLGLLGRPPQAALATPAEVLALVEREPLPGTGIGYVDAQLLAAARLTPEARLWTRDRALAVAATRLGIAFEGEGAER